MTTQATIREAMADDLPFLAEHDSHVQIDVLEGLVERGQILVAEEEGTLRGWLRWNLFWDEIPFMNMLLVMKEHRGRGIGNSLLESWEGHLRNTGYDSVLTSSLADEQAQHFYRRRGYLDCGSPVAAGRVHRDHFSQRTRCTQP